jgi:hypothetical protein
MELLFDHAVVCRTFDGGILARDQLPDGGFHLFVHRDRRQLGDAFDHRALSFSSSRSTITTTKVASCSTPLAGLAVKVVDGFFLVGPLQRRCRPRAQFATPEGAFVVRRVYANQRRATIAFEKGAPGERAFKDALTAWGDYPTASTVQPEEPIGVEHSGAKKKPRAASHFTPTPSLSGRYRILRLQPIAPAS